MCFQSALGHGILALAGKPEVSAAQGVQQILLASLLILLGFFHAGERSKAALAG